MARQKGIIRLEGKAGNLSFYSSVFGDIVRTKGGASKEKIKKSPAFARLREHHREFSACATAGKLFRRSLARFTRHCPDHRLVWRVTQVMNRLKDLDDVSIRGERRVETGLARPEGKALLTGFSLNSEAPLEKILKKEVHIAPDGVSVLGLVPMRDLKAPAGATHVQLTCLALNLDTAAATARLETASRLLSYDGSLSDVHLKPLVPPGSGRLIFLLQISFLQEVNGIPYALADKTKSCLDVVAVL